MYPGLRGAPILLHWNTLEPRQGDYDWPSLDLDLEAANAKGLYYTIELLVGPNAPAWIYDLGVPKVYTDKEGWVFPFYFNDVYVQQFLKLNSEVVEHLKALPESYKKALSFVTLNNGATGDPYCYKGEPLDKKYAISREAWEQFRRLHFGYVHGLLGKDGLASITMAFTHISDDTESFLHEQFPNIKDFKNGMASHGYHIPDKIGDINTERSQAFDGAPTLGGTHVRWFGEMDREWLNGWFQRAPMESFWWSAIYALHMGLSRWKIRGDALESSQFHFAFDFFNKHAPYIDAASSPYAFCALRDGLDANNTARFSELAYGSVNNPESRVMKILNDFEQFGARVENTDVAGVSQYEFRQRSGYVDVLYGGVQGNYHRFLYQIEPSLESQGWWHVGDKSWPYGRFARSFKTAGGKNAMYFRLDEQFISEKSTPHQVTVSITYFDDGGGSWDLLYSKANAGVQSAAYFTCGYTWSWKKVQIVLPDAMLDNSLQKGADLILRHIDGSDTKFHMIELDES